MFSEALMCFGASSTTVDEDDNGDTSNEVTLFFSFLKDRIFIVKYDFFFVIVFKVLVQEE